MEKVAAKAMSIQEQYVAALARAEGVMVMGKGTRKSDGAVVYGVNSASEANRVYIVAVLPGRLECACRARGYCKHRAATHKRMLDERAAATIAQHPTARQLVTATPRTDDDRASAMLARSNAAFSLFKQ